MLPSYQQTIKKPFTLTGVGVHSGAPARLTVKPAAANLGLIFIRTDITDTDNVIQARWDNVTDTRLCTVLSNKAGISVSTMEHLFSAFAAVGLDNAVIEIDGPEVPIMDGSAIAFIEALRQTGLSKQKASRRLLRIKKRVSYQEGDKEVCLTPAADTRFSFDIDFANKTVGRQTYSHRLYRDDYTRDIASARTFGFLHEVEQLRKMGLARGGSLDNAVVIDGDHVMNPGGLRFKDEFVRHKILDAIGDLFLAGMGLMGHYHGIKAGHALNNKILHVLFSTPGAYEIVTLADDVAVRAPVRLFTEADRTPVIA